MVNMEKQKLYICYSINDFYAREAGISLIGFFENNPDYEPEEVFFLDYGVHPLNKERLGGIATRYGKRVTWLNAKAVTDSVRREFSNLKGWKGSMAPNAKAFVDQIFPDYVERLLFIDADTVVAGSVAELQRLDMGGAALGVVISNGLSDDVKSGRVELYSGNQIYFNSGVLLYDLTVWRRENCHQMIVDTLHKKKRLKWPDQTLLNNAIPQRLLKVLPLKYNYFSHAYHPRQERGWMRLGHFYSDEVIEEAIQHPVIINYLGGWPSGRPWCEKSYSSRAEDYFRYKALSPWKDTPLFPPLTIERASMDFMQRWNLWQLRQMQVLPSFLLSWALAIVYGQVNRVVSRFHKGPDEPSEGKEPIDLES